MSDEGFIFILLLLVALLLFCIMMWLKNKPEEQEQEQEYSGDRIDELLTVVKKPHEAIQQILDTRWKETLKPTPNMRDPIFKETREATTSEQEKMFIALAQTVESIGDRELTAPEHWLVIDTPLERAYAINKSLVISRELIKSPSLPAVIAWGVWWIHTQNSVLFQALRHQVKPLFPTDRDLFVEPYDIRPQPIDVIMHGGHDLTGVSLTFVQTLRYHKYITTGWSGLTNHLERFDKGTQEYEKQIGWWGKYWKEQQFLADEFTVLVGQGKPLAELLSKYAELDTGQGQDQMNFFNPLAIRIDRIEQMIKQEEEVSSE